MSFVSLGHELMFFETSSLGFCTTCDARVPYYYSKCVFDVCSSAVQADKERAAKFKLDVSK